MKTPPAGRPEPKRMEPLWDRVDKNRWRLIAYLLFFWLTSAAWLAAVVWSLGVIAFLFAGASGKYFEFLPLTPLRALLAGLIVSFLNVWWTLARSERWLLRRLDAHIVPKGEMYDTKMAVKDMAIAAGMVPAPAFYLMDSDNVNAFVFKAISRRPVIGVTAGLVKKLTLEQQRAVFANLVARLVTGDTMITSAVVALMAPLHAWRDHRLSISDGTGFFVPAATEDAESKSPIPPGDVLLFLAFGPGLALLAELVAAAFRRSQLTAAEKADAQGMLLLKDPHAMLGALEECVRRDNVVVSAGETLGPLFYCWTGDSTNDDDDPEWRRVARLREVLGVEGHVFDDADASMEYGIPAAPRLTSEGDLAPEGSGGR